MSVLQKARDYCSEFSALNDFFRKKEVCDVWMASARPFLSKRGEGYTGTIPLIEVLDTNGALAIWMVAHRICAEREQKDPQQYFAPSRVRSELDRLESLMFNGWVYAEEQQVWERVYLSGQDFTHAAKALDALLSSGYQIWGYEPPEPDSALTMRLIPAAMRLISQIRQRERGEEIT